MNNLKERLYISGMDPNGHIIAKENGLGFEVTKFSWAPMLEDSDAINSVKEQVKFANRFWLHAPFAELFPCAIDPLAKEIAQKRFNQAISMAGKFDIKNIVIHSGFVPMIYFPEWFIEQSICFWTNFLENSPKDIRIALENVLDPTPDMLIDIVKGVNDPRLGLCLDIGHANVFLSKLSPKEWAKKMSPYLFHTHIHNNDGTADYHNPLGKGTIDMKPTLDAIIDTNASITIETMESKACIEWLTDNNYL